MGLDMTMSLNVRRVLGSACFLFTAVFAAMFTLVAISKITVLSPVVVFALALYGGTAATLFVAGRALFRRR
jgi:hypothetical protein